MLPRIDQAQADPLVDELAEPAARDCPPPTLRCAARPSTSAPFVVVRCARRRAIRPRFRRSTKRDRPIESRRPRPDCLVTLRLSVVFDSRRRRRPATPAQYHRIASCSVLKTGRGGRRARAPRTDPGRAAAGIGNSYTCRRPAAAEAAARDTRARCYEHGAKTE